MFHQVMRVFGFTLNFIKNIVMSFNANNLVIANQSTEITNEPLSSSQLNSGEIEVLLSLIKRSTFLGEDIENLYNLVIKLQKQYIEQTK
jgi:hypothetical protein